MSYTDMLYYVMVSNSGILNGFILINRNCLLQASEVHPRFEVFPPSYEICLFPDYVIRYNFIYFLLWWEFYFHEVCCDNSYGLLYFFSEKCRVRKSMMLFSVLAQLIHRTTVSSILISTIITSVLTRAKDCQLRQEAFHTVEKDEGRRGVSK